jgi:hypothetical protein
MKTNKKTDETPEKAAVKKALAEGRNANDNFQDHEADDYGTSLQDEDEMLSRNEVKSGTGQSGKERNRNDDFND